MKTLAGDILAEVQNATPKLLKIKNTKQYY